MAYKETSLIATGTVNVRPCDYANNQDNVAEVQVSGDFTTAVATFQSTQDIDAEASASYSAVQGVRLDTGSVENTPTLTDATTRKWKCPIDAASQFRFNLSSIASNTITVSIRTYYVEGGIGLINSSSAVVNSATTITSNSATALAVGRQGTTTPQFTVDASAATVVTGLKVTGAASGSGMALVLTGGNGNENMTLDATGTGIITIQGTATGGCNVRIPVQTVAASGTAIGNAAAVVEGYTYVTAANNANAVKLPVAGIGARVILKNTTATAFLAVFPQVSSQINALGANNGYNIGNAAVRTFTKVTSTLWYADPETII